MSAKPEKYWRIRLKAGNRDHTKRLWAMNQVGIWYGPWTPEEFRNAQEQRSDLASYIWELKKPTLLKHGWKKQDIHKGIEVAKRFFDIQETDWVVVYFDQTLHLGRVGELGFNPEHEMNSEDDFFKFRPVSNKKAFPLNRLPDCFRLIPMAGRGNVHEYWDTNWHLVRLLAQCRDVDQVLSELEDMSAKDWFDILGPASWESLCFGYLVLTNEFVPTGLKIGGTLAGVDIVGRRFMDGRTILAQCKKDPEPKPMDARFIDATRSSRNQADIYYFPYGGCIDSVDWVKVVTWKDIEDWSARDPKGKRYLEMFRRVDSAF